MISITFSEAVERIPEVASALAELSTKYRRQAELVIDFPRVYTTYLCPLCKYGISVGFTYNGRAPGDYPWVCWSCKKEEVPIRWIKLNCNDELAAILRMTES